MIIHNWVLSDRLLALIGRVGLDVGINEHGNTQPDKIKEDLRIHLRRAYDEGKLSTRTMNSILRSGISFEEMLIMLKEVKHDAEMGRRIGGNIRDIGKKSLKELMEAFL